MANMTNPEIIAAVITSILASASGIITLVYNLRAKAREEDRKEKDAELDRQLRLMAAETAAAKERSADAAMAARAAKVELAASRKERSEQIDELKVAIAENTKVSVDAFNVANGHNEKIAQLRQDMLSASAPPPTLHQ